MSVFVVENSLNMHDGPISPKTVLRLHQNNLASTIYA